MNYLIEQCIFPIMDGSECVGQGFVADGYFITAAHVVKKYPNCFVDINHQRILLKGTVPLYIGKGDIEYNSKAVDVVIYYFRNMPSFLHLSTRVPISTDTIINCCVFPKFDSSTNIYQNKLSVRPAALCNEDVGNYFYCKCERGEGSSGSPLILGTEVVGIMHGGKFEESLCAFLRPSSFMFPESIITPDPKFLKKMHELGKIRPEEPLTPSYFNRKAREQINDAFE